MPAVSRRAARSSQSPKPEGSPPEVCPASERPLCAACDVMTERCCPKQTSNRPRSASNRRPLAAHRRRSASDRRPPFQPPSVPAHSGPSASNCRAPPPPPRLSLGSGQRRRQPSRLRSEAASRCVCAKVFNAMQCRLRGPKAGPCAPLRRTSRVDLASTSALCRRIQLVPAFQEDCIRIESQYVRQACLWWFCYAVLCTLYSAVRDDAIICASVFFALLCNALCYTSLCTTFCFIIPRGCIHCCVLYHIT